MHSMLGKRTAFKIQLTGVNDPSEDNNYQQRGDYGCGAQHSIESAV